MKIIVALAALLVASTGMAQDAATIDNAFLDAEGDAGEGLDIQQIYWLIDEGKVSIEIDTESLADGAALTAILYTGVEGAKEPDQAYILHHGPNGDHVVMGQGGDAPTLEVLHAPDIHLITFDMDAVIDSNCAFAVARTVTYHEGGQQVEDQVSWTTGSIEDAWNLGGGCNPDNKPSVDIHIDGKESPGGGIIIGLATVGLALALRRHNG